MCLCVPVCVSFPLFVCVYMCVRVTLPCLFCIYLCLYVSKCACQCFSFSLSVCLRLLLSSLGVPMYPSVYVCVTHAKGCPSSKFRLC